MSTCDRALAEAITKVITDAAPWWMKVTRAQRFRLEMIGHNAAVAVERMRSEP